MAATDVMACRCVLCMWYVDAGRPVFDLKGKARELALRKLVDKMEVSVVEEDEHQHDAQQRRSSSLSAPAPPSAARAVAVLPPAAPRVRRRLRIDPFASRHKPWLRAYQKCSGHEISIRDRPHGQPL